MNAVNQLLIIDDDRALVNLLKRFLEAESFRVDAAYDHDSGLAAARSNQHELVILDVMLPGGSGFELLKALRHESAIPVLLLTARGEAVDRILGLEIGADDYLAKPFDPRELVARVKAVLRRFERPLAPGPIRVGEVEIDPVAMTLKVDGKLVTTTATEFRLLEYFARHLGRVFTRDQLLDSVWRDTSYVTPRSVDVYVRRIREKIEPDAENPRYLKTVRGAGYRFEAPK